MALDTIRNPGDGLVAQALGKRILEISEGEVAQACTCQPCREIREAFAIAYAPNLIVGIKRERLSHRPKDNEVPK